MIMVKNERLPILVPIMKQLICMQGSKASSSGASAFTLACCSCVVVVTQRRVLGVTRTRRAPQESF